MSTIFIFIIGISIDLILLDIYSDYIAWKVERRLRKRIEDSAKAIIDDELLKP